MDFTKAVTIVITGIFTRTVAHAFVIVAPCIQAAVDVIRIGVDQGPRGNRGWNQRLDRHLLDVLQHLNHHIATALDHAEDRRFLTFERPASPGPLESPSSAQAPFFATSSGWPL